MSVLNLHEQDFDHWQPSQKEASHLKLIFRKFNSASESRSRKYRILNDRTLEEYWNDSEERWLSLIPTKRKKPWQSAVVKPVTRNKCIGIIANLLDQFIEPDITAELEGRVVEEAARAIKDLIKHSQEKDRYVLKMLLLLTETVSKGTAFIDESYVMEVRKIKEIKSWDPLTNEMETEKKEIIDYEGFRSAVIDPREIYLGNIFEFDIDRQPFIFRRQVLNFHDAKIRYGQLMNWKFVKPGVRNTEEEDAAGDYFEPQITGDMEENDVEVLHYWSKPDDEIAIIVNGILLTKLGTPIPYTHKKYPITKSIFEVMSSRFAYGKSMPDRLQGEQDVIDTLYRMVIDKSYLSIFPPLLAKGFEKITTDIIVPGKVTPVDSESEISVPAGVAGGVGNELNLISYIEGSMDRSSIDPQQLGASASGERSATQVLEAKRGAQTILGLFGFMIAFAVEDMMALRVQNILQFWAKEERLIMKDGQRESIANIFQLQDQELNDGSLGTREISFLPENIQPSSIEIFREEKRLKRRGKNMNKVFIDPEKIRQYNWVVRVKANPSNRMSPELRKVLGLEFYNQFVNEPLIIREKLVADTMKLWDKDPSEYIKSKEQLQAEQQKAQQAAQAEAQAKQGGRVPNQRSQQKGNLTSQLAASQQPNLQELIQA
jgi:hypothetical protein